MIATFVNGLLLVSVVVHLIHLVHAFHLNEVAVHVVFGILVHLHVFVLDWGQLGGVSDTGGHLCSTS
jgi:hypothetical protein